MQKQRRDSNNPANPLIKVAALEIRRTNERISTQASCYASIKLNFKKSKDIVGYTKDKLGQTITVNFTLSIKKATLQVTFQFEDSEDSKHLSISKVTFIEGLTTSHSIKASQESNSSTESVAKGEASLGISPTKVIMKGEAEGKKKHEKKQQSKMKFETKYCATGISATNAGNIVHWSIDSSWTRKEDLDFSGETYLSGEVFKDAATGKHLKACRVAWNRGETSSAMEIHGSVRVMSQDLIIENIAFINEAGTEQKWDTIKSFDMKQPSFFDDKDEFKKRLVQQIIRKHLSSHGMFSEGASIEVCSAKG